MAGLISFDYIRRGLAGAQYCDELLFYTGNRRVEYNFGFAAKGFYCVEHQFLVIKD